MFETQRENQNVKNQLSFALAFREDLRTSETLNEGLAKLEVWIFLLQTHLDVEHQQQTQEASPPEALSQSNK